MVPPTPQPGRPRPIDPHRIRDNHDPPARLAAQPTCHSIVRQTRWYNKRMQVDREPAAADPAHVAPVVVWLSHESCTMNGEVLAVGAGRVAQVALIETLGARAGRIAQPEDFGASLAEIADTKGMSVVRSIADEIRLFGAPIAPELDVSAAYELRT